MDEHDQRPWVYLWLGFVVLNAMTLGRNITEGFNGLGLLYLVFVVACCWQVVRRV